MILHPDPLKLVLICDPNYHLWAHVFLTGNTPTQSALNLLFSEDYRIPLRPNKPFRTNHFLKLSGVWKYAPNFSKSTKTFIFSLWCRWDHRIIITDCFKTISWNCKLLNFPKYQTLKKHFVKCLEDDEIMQNTLRLHLKGKHRRFPWIWMSLSSFFFFCRLDWH